jgi:pimeloyl-ACP methyl ester carboxylesterase
MSVATPWPLAERPPELEHHARLAERVLAAGHRVDWDTQMLFLLQEGYRVVAHDRRGHGRSTQTSDGHDTDHYADDLAALTAHLDLQDAVRVGHSTGGGEVVQYIARHGESRVAKAVLISAVPPLMVQTDTNPGGLPKSARAARPCRLTWRGRVIRHGCGDRA